MIVKSGLLLSSVMALAVLAGCTPPGDAASQSPPAGASAPPEQGAPAAEPPAPAPVGASDPALAPDSAADPGPHAADLSAPETPAPAEPAPPSLAREWRDTRPPKEAEGCYSQQTRPAVIETVTEQVLVRPAGTDPATGTASPALYRTETNHRIVKGGEAMWFRVPCEAEMTPEFIAALQRALTARALYFGPVTGEMDAATQGAVRAYQAPRGLLSPVLSYRAAQELGLIVWVEN